MGNTAAGTPFLAGAQAQWAHGDEVGMRVGAEPFLTKARTLLPGKHHQGASFLGKREDPSSRQGAGQLEMQALASDRHKFLSQLYHFLAV